MDDDTTAPIRRIDETEHADQSAGDHNNVVQIRRRRRPPLHDDPPQALRGEWLSVLDGQPTPLPVSLNATEGMRELYLWKAVWAWLDSHQDGKDLLKGLRVSNLRCFERWTTDLPSSQHRVLSFIRSRTLGYDKVAEVITTEHFLRGVRDRDGRLFQGGSGVRDNETVAVAIAGLVDAGLVTVFPGRGRRRDRPSRIFMPFNRAALCLTLVLHCMRVDRENEHRRRTDRVPALIDHLLHDDKLDQHQKALARTLFGEGSQRRCIGAAWLEWRAGRLPALAYGMASQRASTSLHELEESMSADFGAHTIEHRGRVFFAEPRVAAECR